MGKRPVRPVFEYDTMDDFFADGGPSSYGVGRVLIQGHEYLCNGLVLSQVKVPGSRINGFAMPCGEMNNLGAITAGSSWRLVQTTPAGYSAVRAYIFNANTGVSQAGVKANFSVSDSYENILRPTINQAIDDTQWQNFTWSGANTVTRPVATAPEIPSVVASDWLAVNSLPRADGGSRPLAYATLFQPDAAAVGYANMTGAQAFFNALLGNKHIWSWGTQNVDAVATPANWTNISNQSGACIPFGLEFLFNKQVLSVCAYGDSTCAGTGNTVNISFTQQAAAELDKDGVAVNIWVEAQNGEDQVNYYQRAMNSIAISKPGVIYFQCWSVNGDGSYAGYKAQMSRLLQLLSYCEQNKIILITDTPQPYVAAGGAALSLAELGRYNAILNLLLNLNSPNIRVMDFRSLHDPDKPGVWNAIYGYDSYHPNPAGHLFKMAALVKAIKTCF